MSTFSQSQLPVRSSSLRRAVGIVPVAACALLLGACSGQGDDATSAPQDISNSAAAMSNPQPEGSDSSDNKPKPSPAAPHPTAGDSAPAAPADGTGAGEGTAGANTSGSTSTGGGGVPAMEDGLVGRKPGEQVTAQGTPAEICRTGNGYNVSFIVAAQGTPCDFAEATAGAAFSGHTPGEDLRSFLPVTMDVRSESQSQPLSMTCASAGQSAVKCTPNNSQNPSERTVYLY